MVEVREVELADGQELAVVGDGFDEGGVGGGVEGADAEVAALADLAGGEGVDALAGELGEELGGGDEGLVEMPGGGEGGSDPTGHRRPAGAPLASGFVQPPFIPVVADSDVVRPMAPRAMLKQSVHPRTSMSPVSILSPGAAANPGTCHLFQVILIGSTYCFVNQGRFGGPRRGGGCGAGPGRCHPRNEIRHTSKRPHTFASI